MLNFVGHDLGNAGKLLKRVCVFQASLYKNICKGFRRRAFSVKNGKTKAQFFCAVNHHISKLTAADDAYGIGRV
jgi:hypothetical protein